MKSTDDSDQTESDVKNNVFEKNFEMILRNKEADMAEFYTKMKYPHYRHLIVHPTSEDQIAFENRYIGLIRAEKNARTILPYSQRSNPNLTLHDASHSQRVLEIVNLIIDIIIGEGGRLTPLEIEILYYSAWYHDLGIIISENEYDGNEHEYNHAQLSVQILERYTEEYFGEGSQDRMGFTDSVCKVILSHKMGTDTLPEISEVCGESVRLQLIGSILCLADLCDISKRRAPKIVYQLLSEDLNKKPLDTEENKHWLANIGTDVEINVEKRLIFVNYCDESVCGIILSDFRKWGSLHLKTIARYVKFPVSFQYIYTGDVE